MSLLTYRPDIDGLRSLAILPVLLFHIGVSGVSGGYVGVDIFFVISGYLITAIIARECGNGTFTFSHFWARRARRILPAALFVMAGTLVAGWFYLAPNDYFDLGRSARSQTYFSANFFFWQESGYFDGPSEFKPLLHTWSLAVEEQFYMLFPALYLLLHKFFPQYKKTLLASIFLASLVASMILVYSQPSATFYLLHTRAWELLMGSLLAIAIVGPVRSQKQAECISLAGFLAILYAVFFYTEKTVFPGASALVPTLGTAAIIWGNSHHDTLVKRILSLRPLVFIGLISYSLYLWHWPLIVFARYTAVDPLTFFDKGMLLILSFLLAWLSWLWVEGPFRKKQLLPSNKQILWGMGLSALIVAIVGQQIRRTEGYPPRLSEQARNYAMAADWDDDQKRCYKLTPKEIENGKLCRFGGSNAIEPGLLYWGDSHSAAILPAVREKAKEHGVRVLHASKSGCPPIFGGELPDHGVCTEFHQAMRKYIRDFNVKDMVIAGRWSVYIYGELNGSEISIMTRSNDKDKSSEEAKIIFQEQFKLMIKEFRDLGVNVWLVRQAPLQAEDIPHVLTKLAIKGEGVSHIGLSLQEHSERQAFVNSVFDEYKDVGLKVLDPTIKICSGNFCPAAKNGYSFYKDDDHLSIQGALMISSMFDPVFNSIKESHKQTHKQLREEALK